MIIVTDGGGCGVESDRWWLVVMDDSDRWLWLRWMIVTDGCGCDG